LENTVVKVAVRVDFDNRVRTLKFGIYWHLVDFVVEEAVSSFQMENPVIND
jgi:hypothetical protein